MVRPDKLIDRRGSQVFILRTESFSRGNGLSSVISTTIRFSFNESKVNEHYSHMSHLRGFSQKQLHKWGWKEGKGLGKVEDGMVSTIEVKRKNNKGGLGHDHGSDFSFHWWDHIFNKAASSIEVCEDEKDDENTSVTLKTTNKKVLPQLTYNKRPDVQNRLKKPLLYGTFVSAGTAIDGKLEKEEDNKMKSTSDNDDSSDDDSSCNEEDLSSNDLLERTYKRTGLTGHKAARHGLKLNGKLKRITDQEYGTFKNGDKHQKEKTEMTVTEKSCDDICVKKKKSKKPKTKKTSQNDFCISEKKKKSKKCKKADQNETDMPKKKKKKQML